MKNNQKNCVSSYGILLLSLIFVLPAVSQGLNYPGNSPIMYTGAGNARNDADNLLSGMMPGPNFSGEVRKYARESQSIRPRHIIGFRLV